MLRSLSGPRADPDLQQGPWVQFLLLQPLHLPLHSTPHSALSPCQGTSVGCLSQGVRAAAPSSSVVCELALLGLAFE